MTICIAAFLSTTKYGTNENKGTSFVFYGRIMEEAKKKSVV